MKFVDPDGRDHGLPKSIQKFLIQHAIEQYNLETYYKIQQCKEGPIIFPFVKAEADGIDVKYFRESSNGVVRSGGSRSWRNNNPGNIRIAKNQIGTAGGFAVFADYETGFSAIIDLLQTDRYYSASILDAISTYAPPNENDTKNYQKLIASFTGLDITKKIKDLTPEELSSVAAAIQRIEGYIVGTETLFYKQEKQE